jgi:Tfp pilus assembly protein PilN
MRAVNLLPREEADGRKAPPLPVLVACVGSVLVTALLAVMFLSASSSVAHQKQALEQAQVDYASVPAPPPPSPAVAKLPQERQTRVAALATALGQRIAWDRLLREVSQVVPSDVWLVTLNALAPTMSTASTAPSAVAGTTLPSGFTVTGCTYSQESVARFLARLQVVPDLDAMTLGKSASSGDSGTGGGASCPNGMFTFTLQGNVHAGGASS